MLNRKAKKRGEPETKSESEKLDAARESVNERYERIQAEIASEELYAHMYQKNHPDLFYQIESAFRHPRMIELMCLLRKISDK